MSPIAPDRVHEARRLALEHGAPPLHAVVRRVDAHERRDGPHHLGARPADLGPAASDPECTAASSRCIAASFSAMRRAASRTGS